MPRFTYSYRYEYTGSFFSNCGISILLAAATVYLWKRERLLCPFRHRRPFIRGG